MRMGEMSGMGDVHEGNVDRAVHLDGGSCGGYG